MLWVLITGQTSSGAIEVLNLKAVFLKIAAVASGITLTMCIVGGLVFWCAFRQKAWDRTAFRIGATKSEPLFKLDEKFQEIGSGIFFTTNVENTTSIDLTLPQNLIVMQEAKSSHALHGSYLKLDREYFIPAHHTVTISLSSDDLCAAHFEPKVCFHNYFDEDQEIVLFDKESRREIYIPIPALTVAKSEEQKPEQTGKK